MAVIPSSLQEGRAGIRLLRVTVTVSGLRGGGWGMEGILDAEELEKEIQKALEDKSKIGSNRDWLDNETPKRVFLRFWRAR